MKRITTVDEYNDLLKNNDICVIKVSASWCNPCKSLALVIRGFDDETQKLFYEIDAEGADEDLLNMISVRNIPVLIFYNKGVEIKRFVGMHSGTEILDVLNDIENT